MIRINRVWSEENKFKPLDFTPGINFIVGDSSKQEDGSINEQRNGSGKSLSIELINFALLKKSNESRITRLPDDILPPSSFVYINLNINNYDVTLARNKLGVILMKINDGDFIEQEESVAKAELSTLCGLDNKISFRELCNFLIKESSYTYTNFLSFFISNTLDKLKASLYFFNLPIDLFKEIYEKQDDFEGLNSSKSLCLKRIEQKGLDLAKLKSLQTDLEIRLKELENGLTYEVISQKVADTSYELQKEEAALSDLLTEKGKLNFSLSEIEEFLSHTNDDLSIDDKHLKSFFNNYISKLGDFVQKDLNQLKRFRDGMSVFQSDMLSNQKEGLINRLESIELQISLRHEKILKFKSIIDSGKNHLQKGMLMSNELINEAQEHTKLLQDIEFYTKELGLVQSDFQVLFNKLQAAFFETDTKEASFRKTFLEIHEKVYRNRHAVFSFDLDVKRNIKNKEYFRIRAEVDRGGSEGTNRVRQIIYDLGLLVNEHTKELSHKLLVHDRLLFGDIDNDATFNILNYLGSLDPNSFQYIGTFNTDAMHPEDANKMLNFNVTDKEVVRLSVQKPLFYKQFKKIDDN